MRLVVTPDIFERFPSVLIGCVVVDHLDNHSTHDFSDELARAQRNLRTALEGANVTEHPRIACWRDAYRAFGAKPKKYPSSIENLVRRTLKNEPLRTINPLVDIYNIVSLNHVLPVGGEDLDCIEGDIRLTHAGENEPEVELLGERQARAPKAGEVIYTDDRGAICRRWNWKEAERTKLTETTKRAVLVLEALFPVTRDDLDEAMAELVELVTAHTNANTRTSVLCAGEPAVELES